METYAVLLSAGNGLGEELLAQAKKVFCALEQRFGTAFELKEILSGEPAIERYGCALREEDLAEALHSRAILFGNISTSAAGGDPKRNPVYALSSARRAFRVCTNVRPVRLQPEYEELSPLKRRITARGMDILIVRDLMGGMINGPRRQSRGEEGREASDLEYYNERIIEHSATFAFRAARARRGLVTSVDKANVLASGKLWRRKVCETGERFPDVVLEHDYVDHAAMELLAAPDRYDVILTSNVFGDILADEVAQISGAPWLFGSAELSMDGRGVYTPNQLHHPNSEALAGTGAVNPCGVIDAAALLLRYSCGREDMAAAVEQAVRRCVTERLFTAEAAPEGAQILSTEELGDRVASMILEG